MNGCVENYSRSAARVADDMSISFLQSEGRDGVNAGL
jgi:hypothetical protein